MTLNAQACAHSLITGVGNKGHVSQQVQVQMYGESYSVPMRVEEQASKRIRIRERSGTQCIIRRLSPDTIQRRRVFFLLSTDAKRATKPT